MIKLGQHADWSKSSYSGGNGACVEVKSTAVTSVDIQDSKHLAGASPIVSLSPAAFTSLVEFARNA